MSEKGLNSCGVGRCQFDKHRLASVSGEGEIQWVSSAMERKQKKQFSNVCNRSENGLVFLAKAKESLPYV
jgi:hypothetical protein